MKYINIPELTGANLTSNTPNSTMNGEVKIWHACLYLRLSKEDGDKEESESITNQRALLLAHAEKLGVTVVDIKIEMISLSLIQFLFGNERVKYK